MPALLARSAAAHNGESRGPRLFDAIAAFMLTAAFLCLEKVLTPPTFLHSAITSFDYWITQPYVTLRYFRSFFFPLFLNIDTDLRAFHSVVNAPVLAGFGFCALLLFAAVFTAWRPHWRPVSFGLWWFLIGLLPTALYPLGEVENDHRMFLPFVGLSLAAVWTGAHLLRVRTDGPTPRAAIAGIIVLALLAFGTYRRNEAWHTEESLWRDDVEKSPNNARGHYGLAFSLQKQPGRVPEAIAEYRAALRIQPDFASASANLGNLLQDMPGSLRDAISVYEAGLRATPNSAELHTNLGTALSRVPGRSLDAISEYRAALRIEPNHASAHTNLGNMLSGLPGRLPEAVSEYEAALRIDPNCPECRNNLGSALAKIPGRLEDAISEYKAALQLRYDFPEAHYNLAAALSQLLGHDQEAISEYEAALRFNPDLAEAQYNLGVVLSRMPNRSEDALGHFRIAQQLRPNPQR